MLHTIYVIGVMFIAPIVCVIIEFILSKNGTKKKLLDLICKWFVFFTLGLRALTAGLMQIVNPSYTAKLLHLTTDNFLAIQELGFAQFGIGVLGILSIHYYKLRKSTAISYGIFMAGAAYLHIIRLSQIQLGEMMSLIGDLLVVAIAIICVCRRDKAKLITK